MKKLIKRFLLAGILTICWMLFVLCVGGLAHATFDLLCVGWRFESHFSIFYH